MEHNFNWAHNANTNSYKNVSSHVFYSNNKHFVSYKTPPLMVSFIKINKDLNNHLFLIRSCRGINQVGMVEVGITSSNLNLQREMR